MNSQMKRYHRSLCAHGVEVHHSPRTWMCSPTQKLPEPHQLRGIQYIGVIVATGDELNLWPPSSPWKS